MTSPFMKFPWLRVAARRSAKLIWWSVTFQLLRKYRERRARLAAQLHFRPPHDDHAIGVPFSWTAQTADAAPGVAVICHMYFDEMAQEFRNYLSNMPFQFDLYITTDTDEKKERIEAVFARWGQGKIEIRLAQNRGRDIAPKLITCADVYGAYEFVLHIHTKHSPYGAHLVGWRSYLLETLIGSPAIVTSIFEIFRSQPQIGMIAPQHLENVRPSIGWGFNYRNVQGVARRLQLDIDVDGDIDFPSGSMFWARSAALQPLLRGGFSFDDFPVENGQQDGTISHIIERLYFFICEAAGFDWVKIARPELLRLTKHRVVSVAGPQELTAFISTHRVRLLNPARDTPSAQKGGPARIAHAHLIRPRTRLLRQAYASCDQRGLNFSEFADAVTNLASGKPGAIDFDEAFYLSSYPDVAAAVKSGTFPCGYVHYCLEGRREGRLWSNGEIARRFGITPGIGKGMFDPVNARPLPSYGPALSALPVSGRPFLLIMFWHLQEDLFYAGYGEFFRDFKSVIGLFSRVVIAVENPQFDARIATRIADRIEVIPAGELLQLTERPTVIVAFNQQLFHKAREMFDDLDNTVYYCQDFEAGFFPYGAEYIMAESAVAASRNLIISTRLLRRFLDARGLLAGSANIFVTTPMIDPLDVAEIKSRKIFLYFRPEPFHSRNLPQVLLSAVERLCEKHSGYEIYMVGSVATSYSFPSGGNAVFVMKKLPKEDYTRLIASCDIVVALIYSGHPGVVAFQAAASGIPTVTNIFESRNAAVLRDISDNLIPYDPVREDLVALIEKGLAMPKGVRSFNPRSYGLRDEGSLDDYFLGIMERARNSRRARNAGAVS